jgi:hypothetical protein
LKVERRHPSKEGVAAEIEITLTLTATSVGNVRRDVSRLKDFSLRPGMFNNGYIIATLDDEVLGPVLKRRQHIGTSPCLPSRLPSMGSLLPYHGLASVLLIQCVNKLSIYAA